MPAPLLLQARGDLAGWQEQVAAAAAQAAAAEQALSAAQAELQAQQQAADELQQGSRRLKEQLAAQVGSREALQQVALQNEIACCLCGLCLRAHRDMARRQGMCLSYTGRRAMLCLQVTAAASASARAATLEAALEAARAGQAAAAEDEAARAADLERMVAAAVAAREEAAERRVAAAAAAAQQVGAAAAAAGLCEQLAAVVCWQRAAATCIRASLRRVPTSCTPHSPPLWLAALPARCCARAPRRRWSARRLPPHAPRRRRRPRLS